MASGDILAELADRKTLNSTKEDTAAILKTIGDFSGGGTEDTVVKILQELLTQPKVIKHIQRGQAEIPHNGQSIKVQLSGFTNVNKMIILINGSPAGSNNGPYSAFFKNFTVNSVDILSGATQAQYGKIISYQVIEFC